MCVRCRVACGSWWTLVGFPTRSSLDRLVNAGRVRGVFLLGLFGNLLGATFLYRLGAAHYWKLCPFFYLGVKLP